MDKNLAIALKGLVMTAMVTAGASAGAGEGKKPCHKPCPPPQQQESSTAPEWSYEGKTCPKHWAKLSNEFRRCSKGKLQSPINFNSAKYDLNVPVAQISYDPGTYKVMNTGHGVKVELYSRGKSEIAIRDAVYHLDNIHFHTPSEHKVGGKKYAAEIHFVNTDSKNGAAVLGVFVKEGRDNPALAEILENAPKEKHESQNDIWSYLYPSDLLPKNTVNFSRYVGSLTTPPCTEGVVWTVYKEPIEASKAQIAALKALSGENVRPAQKIRKQRVTER